MAVWLAQGKCDEAGLGGSGKGSIGGKSMGVGSPGKQLL